MGARAPDATLRHAWVPAADELDRVLVAASARGICYLALDPATALAGLRAWAQRHAPRCALREEPRPLAAAVEQLRLYFAGRLQRFELALDLRGTAFQRAVWSELRAIPFGTTRTYGELAARLGRPGAARAVGLAAGANPVPVIVPCHRLLARAGLGGFSAGVERKRVLLALEGVLAGRDLFGCPRA